MLVIIPHRYMFLNTRTPQCAGLMMYVLCSDRVCSAVEDDGGLVVVCVVIRTEEVVPTEA